jgi:hypothetical protein
MARGRKNKNENYMKERMEILNKLNGILGVSEGNNSFVAQEMNGDEVMKMMDDIKKAFNYSSWSYFVTKGKGGEMSLVKSVYKEMGYVMDRKDIMENKKRKYVYVVRKAENPRGYMFLD